MDIFLAQPKLNGSCGVVFTNGTQVLVKNRHGGNLTMCKIHEQLQQLHTGEEGKWNVYVGEYLCKSKKDQNRKTWNHVYVIFDILVYNNISLTHLNFLERHQFLREIYQFQESDRPYISKITDEIWLVDCITQNFENVYQNIVEIDIYEGLVLKKKHSNLEKGLHSENNIHSQLKCRKPTKNYRF